MASPPRDPRKQRESSQEKAREEARDSFLMMQEQDTGSRSSRHERESGGDSRLSQYSGVSVEEHDVSDLEEDEELEAEETEDEAVVVTKAERISTIRRNSHDIRQVHISSTPISPASSGGQYPRRPVSPLRENEEDLHDLPRGRRSADQTSPTVAGSREDHEHGRDIRTESESTQVSRDTPADSASSSSVSPPLPQESRFSEPQSDTHDLGTVVNSLTTPTVSPNPQRSSTGKSLWSSGPSRPPSKRSSTANLTNPHVPSQKTRVRYSWQSLQDDEPNRPRIHVIKLISNTATSSAGFPQGEAFGFSISPGGRRIAAYNSARLYVLQTAALPVGISQDYALRRRPLAVELTDEANTVSILADDHTVNVYRLGLQRLQRVRTITLDFPTTCIALAPTGGLLAAAYEGGVEIFSLDDNALPTDRRAVRSPKMDRMSFSEDGSTLLGTTTRINVSSTVVVNVPVFPAAPDGIPTHDELKEAWCSELLHPENIRNSSHATFMREGGQTCNERLFAWNGLADTFGILNVGDMQYGNIDFPIVISPPLSTCGGLGAAIHCCPTIDQQGETVAMIVNERTVRLYIVPRKIDDDVTIAVEAHSIDHELDEGYGCPFSDVRWVYSASAPSSSTEAATPSSEAAKVRGRLIVTSPGGLCESGLAAEETVEDIEGGRIILFDFDPQFAGQPGKTYDLVLGKSPPFFLEEERIDVADQVALVRRRTVNQSKKGLASRPATLGRAATTFGNRPAIRTHSPNGDGLGSTLATPGDRASVLSLGSLHPDDTTRADIMGRGEQAAAFEEPYAQFAPRSQVSLQRAASNAQRHRFQTLEERVQENISVDTSGNFLALPEYTEEPNAPLPSRFRAMAGLDQPAPPLPPSSGLHVNGMPADARTHTPLPSIPAEEEPVSIPFIATHDMSTVAGDDYVSELIRPGAVSPSHSMADSAFASGPLVTPMSSPGPGWSHIPTSDSSRLGVSSAASRTDTLPISPVDRTGTFDSLASMPRGLQRAYANAPLALGPTLGVGRSRIPDEGRTGALAGVGAWEGVSPIVPSPSSPYATNTSPGGAGVSPSSATSTPLTPFPPGAFINRHSPYTTPARAPSSAGSLTSLNTSTHHLPSVASNDSLRRLPPHMQNFRLAATANANTQSTLPQPPGHHTDIANDTNPSASLFPPAQPTDLVPLRNPPSNIGSVAHPVTGWHPPAAAASGPRSGSAHSSSDARSTDGTYNGISVSSPPSRRAALSTITSEGKRLGFFRKITATMGTEKEKSSAPLAASEILAARARREGKRKGKKTAFDPYSPAHSYPHPYHHNGDANSNRLASSSSDPDLLNYTSSPPASTMAGLGSGSGNEKGVAASEMGVRVKTKMQRRMSQQLQQQPKGKAERRRGGRGRGVEGEGQSVLETKSVMTWMNGGREGKCAVM